MNRERGRQGSAVILTSLLAALLAASGLICVGNTVRHWTVLPPEATADPPVRATAPQVVHPVARASLPVSITIAAIGVRSRLGQVGLTTAGEMQVPAPGPHYDEAAWYRYSPTPGSRGPAVIVGHVDSATQGSSVFYRLGRLHPGNTIRVARSDGSVATFVVDAVREYRKSRFPSRLVYGDTEDAALRLITCGGRFDRAAGHYVNNIVVFASLRMAGPLAG